MKKRPAVRFNCNLPVMTQKRLAYKRITKKVWETLPEQKRDTDEVTTGWGRNKVSRTVYQEVIIIAPYFNPAIDRVRAKLKRIPYAETLYHKDGVEFINITTCEELL